MEKNDDGKNGSSSIESTVTLNSSSPRSLGMIRCMQAALMLPSLRTRSTEKDDDGYHKMKFRAKRLLADVVMRKRTEMMKVRRIEVIETVVLTMLVSVILFSIPRVFFGNF